jgi:hypothetical protein
MIFQLYGPGGLVVGDNEENIRLFFPCVPSADRLAGSHTACEEKKKGDVDK